MVLLDPLLTLHNPALPALSLRLVLEGLTPATRQIESGIESDHTIEQVEVTVERDHRGVLPVVYGAGHESTAAAGHARMCATPLSRSYIASSAVPRLILSLPPICERYADPRVGYDPAAVSVPASWLSWQ
jgi:hypothetical protein